MIDVIYLIIIAMVGGCLGLLGFFFILMPADFYNLFRIPYYHLFLLENSNVTKRILQRSKGQWFINYNKKAYLIPFDNLIRNKSGQMFFADIHNAMPIHSQSIQEQEYIKNITKQNEIINNKSIKSKSLAHKILSQVPIVKRFVYMKEGTINEIVFANKFILNPLFIIDSCMLYIMLTQNITEKIMAKPKTFMDTIAENLIPLVIIIAIIIIVLYYIQHRGGV